MGAFCTTHNVEAGCDDIIDFAATCPTATQYSLVKVKSHVNAVLIKTQLTAHLLKTSPSCKAKFHKFKFLDRFKDIRIFPTHMIKSLIFFRFSKGTGTTDGIFTIRQVQEKMREKDKKGLCGLLGSGESL